MICLIGNSGLVKNIVDGQTTKVRLYLKKMKDEGLNVCFIDLENFTKHPLSILIKIKKAIAKCDRIVLLTAQRGAKILIPYINRINKKHKKPFILPLIGIGILHYSVDKLNESERVSFFVDKNYSLCRPSKKVKKQLSKITHILPETELLTEIYKGFYNLSNVSTLNNFRDVASFNLNAKKHDDALRLIYLSRVIRIKGIFDIMEAVSELKDYNIHLDIYGATHFDEIDQQLFKKYCQNDNIKYLGLINNEKVVSVLSNYDLFVFPTRYLGEGTPGVISESLIVCTPILSSNFPQAKYLMNDGFDSLFFKLGDKKDLKEKIIYLIDNPSALEKMRTNCKKSRERFLYSHERDKFLSIVCGVNK